MNFPELNKSGRDREYNLYSSVIRKSIVYAYLFEGLSHRALDQEFIGLDSIKSKGYQSMGILHFLGLRNEHKNFFNGISVNSAIEILKEINASDTSLIIEHLKEFDNQILFDAKKIENEFQRSIEISKQLNAEKRRNSLVTNKNTIPEKIEVITVVFKRNPDVVVETLNRANGFCERCHKKAPFLRAKDNSPYLEVHHNVPLSEGGKDIIENAIALCPNCHREAHYGIKR
jgi:5-methylcytosine-specific restriction protein A